MSALLLEYRCRAKGCLLLRVWQTPGGPQFLVSGHRLSDRYTLARHLERLALAAGHSSETPETPGDWIGQLDEQPALLWLPLMCGHVRETAWIFAIRKDVAGAAPGRPKRILWP